MASSPGLRDAAALAASESSARCSEEPNRSGSTFGSAGSGMNRSSGGRVASSSAETVAEISLATFSALWRFCSAGGRRRDAGWRDWSGLERLTPRPCPGLSLFAKPFSGMDQGGVGGDQFLHWGLVENPPGSATAPEGLKWMWVDLRHPRLGIRVPGRWAHRARRWARR